MEGRFGTSPRISLCVTAVVVLGGRSPLAVAAGLGEEAADDAGGSAETFGDLAVEESLESQCDHSCAARAGAGEEFVAGFGDRPDNRGARDSELFGEFTGRLRPAFPDPGRHDRADRIRESRSS